MHLCVFEDEGVDHFLPLAYTRAVYDLRLGMISQLDALREAFGNPPTLLHARQLIADVVRTEHELPVNRIPPEADVLFVNGRWLLRQGEVLERLKSVIGEPRRRLFLRGNHLLAAWIPSASTRLVEHDAITAATMMDAPAEEVSGVVLLERLWDLHANVQDALRRDYTVRTGGLFFYERPGVDVQDAATLRAGERIYIGPGSVVRPGAVLNADDGPIYIGRNVDIRERAVIKGPCFIGAGTVVMTGADLDGCSIGPAVKIGGQVKGTVFEALSNKAHGGYVGDAYIGRWCNLGADTNASNLRNDYAETRMYDAVEGRFVATGQTFLGLVMGDHSKAGIDTMFNTATVVGVSCNLYGAGFMPRHVPSFTWGEPGSFGEYRLDKALEVAETVMRRRDFALTDAHRENLRRVFELTRGLGIRG